MHTLRLILPAGRAAMQMRMKRLLVFGGDSKLLHTASFSMGQTVGKTVEKNMKSIGLDLIDQRGRARVVALLVIAVGGGVSANRGSDAASRKQYILRVQLLVLWQLVPPPLLTGRN